MTTAETERFREILTTERERVRAAIDNLRAENPGSIEEETGELVSSSADNHLADTASETFERELDEGLEEDAARQLREVEAALARIEHGRYGTCETCGQAIPEERLEAIPWASLCVDDARKQAR